MKHTSKTAPIQVQPKGPGNLKQSSNIIDQLRWIIIAGACCGINRLSVLKSTRIVTWPSHLHILFLLFISCYQIFFPDDNFNCGSCTVYRTTTCIVNVVLICSALLFNKKKLNKMLHNINMFDEKLNIIKDISLTTPIIRGIMWIMMSIAYTVVEYWLLIKYFLIDFGAIFLAPLYISLLAYEIEQVFYSTLLRTIMVRLIIIKAHVRKIFQIDHAEANKNEKEKIKDLAKNVQLDVTSVHNAYILLHKCSEQLNAVMDFQMIIIIFSAGLSTVMLMKSFITIIQTRNANSVEMQLLLIILSLRCVKYSVQIVFPCYISSTTTSIANNIRTMLHDALNTLKLDKVERRKIKAVIQMTRENKFLYALWGVIRLDMALPLSYLSLCTTYLVIVIQFSKFLD